MTTAADILLQNAGKRRLLCKIDGLEPILWEDDGTGTCPTTSADWSQASWDDLVNVDLASAGAGGYHVAISDSLFVVGDPLGGTGGQVFIYKLIDGTWTYQRTIANPRATAGEQFGRSVSVSGTTIAIGCPYTHLNSGGTVDRGCVDVYVDEGATLEQTIQSDDYGGNADNYGWCVSLCSDRLAVGAPGRFNLTAQDGAAYTHTRAEGVWTQEQKISSPKPEVGGAFGRSIALTSDGLAIQQYGYLADGELWVYRLVEGTWTAGTEIGIAGCSADGEDTDKIALSGNLLAFHQNDAGNSVEVWWWDGSTWSLKSDIALTSAHHVSVACSALAHLVVIGNSYYGQLKIYSEVEGVCTLVKTVDAPRIGEFGSHCAINNSATKSWIAEGDGGTAAGDEVSILGGTARAGWSRSGLICLERPAQDLSWGLDVGGMSVSPPSMTITLANITDSSDETKYYFAKLFAPGRHMQSTEKVAHLTVQLGDSYQLDATDSTVIVSQDVSSSGANWTTPGTAYLPRETFSYTATTNGRFSGCTRGLYPCFGEAAAQTIPIPRSDDGVTSGVAVSTVPYSWIGRRIALYVLSFDEMSNAWNAEGDEVLLFVGRIKQIRYNGSDGTWELGCESILADLDRKLGQNMPKAPLKGINLLGPRGCQFQVWEWMCAHQDGVGAWYDEYVTNVWNIAVDAGVYATPQHLADCLHAKLGNTLSGVYIGVYFVDGKFVLKLQYGGSEMRRWEIRQMLPTTGAGVCHVLDALGFKLEGTNGRGMIEFGPEQNMEWNEYLEHSAENAPATAYHPTHDEYNGMKLCVDPDSISKLWTNQGDYGATSATIMVDKHRRTFFSSESDFLDGAVESRYCKRYNGTATGTCVDQFTGGSMGDYSALTLRYDEDFDFPITGPPSAIASWFGIHGGAIAAREGKEVSVKQVYAPHRKNSAGTERGPFELLLYPMLSTGTTDYNIASGGAVAYDKLPYQWAGAVDADLVDDASFRAADQAILDSPLAKRYRYVLDEPISMMELLKREAILFGYVLAWDYRISKLSLKHVYSHDVDLAAVTLSDANNADPEERPDLDMSDETVLNNWEIQINYNEGTDKYDTKIVVSDDDSQIGMANTVKTVKVEHSGVLCLDTDETIEQLLKTLLLSNRDTFRYPWQVITRSLAPSLMGKLSIGDSVFFTGSNLPDPYGGGTMSIDCNALVLNVGWSLEDWTGTCTLLLNPRDQTYLYLPWGGSALIDRTAANAGWNSTDKQFKVVALQYGEAGDSDDAAWITAGDKIDVVSRDFDGTTELRWNNLTVAKNYEADGAELVTMDAGTGLSGWDTSLQYVIIPSGYAYLSVYQTDTTACMSNATTLTVPAGSVASVFG